MRHLLVAVVVGLLTLVASAQEEPPERQQGFDLGLEAVMAMEVPPFDPELAAQLRSPEELTQALWGSPLGRTRLHLAAEQAALGRQGLVGGGHMLAVGLGPGAVGGEQSSLGLWLSGTPWSELSPSERSWAVFQASVATGVILGFLNNLD